MNMKKTELTASLSRTVNKVGLQLKKRSPEILMVAGVVGTVASAVMACKATLKVEAIMEESNDTIEKIHEARALDGTPPSRIPRPSSSTPLTMSGAIWRRSISRPA